MTINEQAAAWWAERLTVEDKREAFRKALVKVLDAEPWRSLYVDYDPDKKLRQALNDVGIECSGHFFSADNLLPRKTGLHNCPTGLYGKEGYGASYLHIESGEPQTDDFDDD